MDVYDEEKQTSHSIRFTQSLMTNSIKNKCHTECTYPKYVTYKSYLSCKKEQRVRKNKERATRVKIHIHSKHLHGVKHPLRIKQIKNKNKVTKLGLHPQIHTHDVSHMVSKHTEDLNTATAGHLVTGKSTKSKDRNGKHDARYSQQLKTRPRMFQSLVQLQWVMSM